MIEIVEALASGKNVLIASHAGFDGDGLGASLALKKALERRGARVTVINDRTVPFYLRFLPGAEVVQTPDDLIGLSEEFDLGLLVDCAQFERAGRSGEMVSRAERVAVIDHHTDEGPADALCLIDSSADSVCAVVYEILLAMGVPVDTAIARCLYVGLMTDTGSFRHGNTTENSFTLASELVKAGVNPYEISTAVYETMKISTIRLLGIALQRLQLSEDGRMAWTTLSLADFAAAGAEESETEGIVNYGRTIAGVKVSAFLRERSNNTVHATMRSKEGIDVAEIAREFGGGGHRAAAGCTLEGPVETAAEKLLAAIRRRVS